MSIPLEIEFRNMDRSEAVETAIRERCAKLERFGPSVLRCKVPVEAPHKHHGKGNLHSPGAEIVANRGPGRNHAHEDVYVAVRDAINAASRQLQDRVRIQRGQVKTHEPPTP
jgi:ribosome-associated translation inhibitor RaiA